MSLAWRFRIYRDGDSFRLRKVILELLDENNELLDRRRMFGAWFSTARYLKRVVKKQNRMIRLAEINRAQSVAVVSKEADIH